MAPWGDYGRLQKALDAVWNHVEGQASTQEEYEQLIAECRRLTPGTEDFDTSLVSTAMDASEGTARYKLRTYTGPSVLFIDELRYLPLDQPSAKWLFQVVSRRYEKGSIILTSNCGFADWGQVFADPVAPTAIVDRLLHAASVLNIRGCSYRMRRYREDSEARQRRDVDG